jgi:hypothetical protein
MGIEKVIGSLKKQRAEVEENLRELRAESQSVRSRIAELEQERAEILATPVTKADFIEYVLLGVDNVGKTYPGKLAAFVSKGGDYANPSVAMLAQCEEGGNAGNKYLLTCDPFLPVDITADALYFVFAEEIKQAARKALDARLRWNFPKTMARKEAAARLAAIDGELAKLNERLTDLIEAAEAFGEEV